MLPKIIDGLKDLFPEVGEMTITPETTLGELPDWDSMAAVNFQTFLEGAFGVSVPQDLLGEEATIGDVMAVIENPAEAGVAN